MDCLFNCHVVSCRKIPSNRVEGKLFFIFYFFSLGSSSLIYPQHQGDFQILTSCIRGCGIFSNTKQVLRLKNDVHSINYKWTHP